MGLRIQTYVRLMLGWIALWPTDPASPLQAIILKQNSLYLLTFHKTSWFQRLAVTLTNLYQVTHPAFISVLASETIEIWDKNRNLPWRDPPQVWVGKGGNRFQPLHAGLKTWAVHEKPHIISMCQKVLWGHYFTKDYQYIFLSISQTFICEGNLEFSVYFIEYNSNWVYETKLLEQEYLVEKPWKW